MAKRKQGSIKATDQVLITAADLAADVSGILPVVNGGSGQSVYTDGQLLIGNTTGNTLTKATLTAGANVTITNAPGSITIAASGGSSSPGGATTQVQYNNAGAFAGSANMTFDGTTLSVAKAEIVSSTAQALIVSSLGNTLGTSLELGAEATGDRLAFIDFHSDDTYTDYSLRILRNTGANGASQIVHRGTGALLLQSSDLGSINLNTNSQLRLQINSAGQVSIGNTAGSGVALSTTAAAKFSSSDATYTDSSTSASGTVAHGTLNSLSASAIAAINATVTYTNASTLYIAGAPTNGTNVTITNPYSVYVNSGKSFFGGGIDLGSQETSSVVTPSATNATLFFDSSTGALKLKTDAGRVYWYQQAIANGNIGLWQPSGNTLTIGILGLVAPVAVGTATVRTVATTNAATMLKRLGYVSAATAGSLCGNYSNVAQYRIGGAGSGIDGFIYKTTIIMSDPATVAGARAFFGLSSAIGAPTNVEPSALTNCIGLAQLSTATTLYIVYGGSAAQTAISLGANFPASGLSTDAYRLTLYADPALNNLVTYLVERIGTAFTATGTLTGTAGTALPLNTTLLAHRAWRCNNATALACGIDVGNIYFEQL